MAERDFGDVPDDLHEMMALLEENRKRLKQDMHAGLAEKGGYNDKHGRAAKELAAAHAAMGRELRAWLKHQKEKAGNLSIEEKVKAAVTFLQGLSRGDRLNLYKGLAALETARPDGISIALLED
jgi:uncharacterized membrane protein